MSAAPVTSEIQLAGGDRFVWLIERHRTDTAEMTLVIAHRRIDQSGTPRFYPLMPAGSLSGRVLRTVTRGDSLHAFYRDGSHWRYSPRTGPWQVREQLDHVELALPNAAVPIALATDIKSQSIYAVVSARTANTLAAKQREDQIEAAEGEADSSKSDLKQALPLEFETDLALVRYEGRRWIADRETPDDLPMDVTHFAMLAADGVVHLVYELAEAEGSHRLIHRVSQTDDKAWSEPIIIPLEESLTNVSMGWVNDKPVLAFANEASGGFNVRTAELNDQTWTWREPLVDDAGEPAHFAGRLAFAFSGEKIAVATVADDGDIQFGTWPVESDKGMVTLSSVTTQIRPPPPAVPPSVQVLLQYAVLGAVLSVLFFWRREHVVMVPELKSNEITAPHLRRCFALIIDIFVTLPAWFPIMFWLWSLDGMSLEDYRQAGQQFEGSAIGWYGLPTLGLVLGLYATVFEGFRQATLGKQAMGLIVKMHDGKACTWSAAMGRNAARVIEFAFPPLVLLVVMTPSKLRLGDMLARTFVVQKLEFSPEPSESENESDSDHFESQ